jgi:hypothetical protein
MTAQFKLGYDPSDGIKGLQALRDALLDAEKAGKKVPPSLIQMIDKTIEVARSADTASKATDSFDQEIQQLEADLKSAEDLMGSYSVSTMDAAKAADIAAGKYDTLGKSVSAGNSKIDRAKDAFGGLEAILNNIGLGALGNFFGALEAILRGVQDLGKSSDAASTSATAFGAAQTKAAASTSAAAKTAGAATVAAGSLAAAEGTAALTTKAMGSSATKAAVQVGAMGVAQAATTKIIVDAQYEVIELGVVSAITSRQLALMGTASNTAAAGVNNLRTAITGTTAATTGMGAATAASTPLLTAAATQAGKSRAELQAMAASAAAFKGEMAAAGAASAATTVTFAGLATGAALVAGAAYAAYINWQDYNEVIEQTADKNSLLDGTMLSIGQALGLLTEEMVNESEATKDGIKFTDDYRKKMAEAEDQAMDTAKALADAVDNMGRSITDSRNAMIDAENLAQQNDAGELERQIDGIISETKRLYDERKISMEDVQKRQERINQLEGRRVEIINEQKAAEQQKIKETKEAEERQYQESEQRLKEFEEKRKETERAVAEEEDRLRKEKEKKEKDDYDARMKMRLDALNREDKAKADASQKEQQREQQSSSEPKTPYGEGMAPTAGTQTDTFAAAISGGDLPSFGYGGRGVAGGMVGNDLGLGAELPSFGYQDKVAARRQAQAMAQQQGEEQPLTADAAARDIINATVDNPRERNRLVKQAAGGDKEKEKRFREDLQDGAASDPELQKAQKDLVEKQLQTMEDNGTLSKDMLQLIRQSIDKIQQTDADQQQMAQDIQDLKQVIGQVGSKKNAGDFRTTGRGKAQRQARGN